MIKLKLSESKTFKQFDQEPFSRNLQSKLYSHKESLLSFTTDPELFQQTSLGAKFENPIPQNINSTIEKKAQERTMHQNSSLVKYLLKFKIFKDLAEKFSTDVVKHMIKDGMLKLYNEGQIVVSQGKAIKKVRILLTGQVSSIVEDGKIEQKQQLWQILDQLVQKVGKHSKKFKSNSNKNQNQSLTKSFIMKKQTIRQFTQMDFTQKIQPNTMLNFLPLVQDEPKHTQTLVATKNETLIFVISLHQFFQSLFLFYNAQMNQLIKTFKKTPIFNSFQNSKLKFLVQRLQLVEIKRNQYVFKEGDQSSCFYLLIEGQVQISKTIQILAQNPNNLYKSRAKLSKEHQNKNIKVLPYANFNGVYHYEPQRKIIVLTIINPICVFGQQQVIQNKTREVNAKVASLRAKMYKIPLHDVEQFCAKLSDSAADRKLALVHFFSLIQESITLKKVLFRQNHLAEMVLRQNKSKYSTLFKDQEKRKATKSTNISKRKYIIYSPKKKQSAIDDVPPTYNHLNFTDFQKTNQEQLQTIPSQSLTTDETKIAKLMHGTFSNELIKQSQDIKNTKQIRIRNYSNEGLTNKKVTLDSTLLGSEYLNDTSLISKKRLNQKRESQKITLQEPLFTMSYFKNQYEFEKKLVFVAKKKKLQQIYRTSF